MTTPRPRAPQPTDGDALAHSDRLRALIQEQVLAAGGKLPFWKFMELALYAPGLGYYSAGAMQVRPGRRFRHRAGAVAVVRRLRGRCGDARAAATRPEGGIRRDRWRQRRVRRDRAREAAGERCLADPLRDPGTQRRPARAPARTPAGTLAALAVRTGRMAGWSTRRGMEWRAVRQRGDRCVADAALRDPRWRGVRGVRRARQGRAFRAQRGSG